MKVTMRTRLSSVYRFLPYIALFVYFASFSMAARSFWALFSTRFLVLLAILPFVIIALWIMGVIGLAHYLRARRNKEPLEPKYRDFARIAAFGFACFAAALIINAASNIMYDHLRFDAATWRDESSVEWHAYELTLRQRMSKDLMESVLPRLDRAEAEALLGKAEWVSQTNDGGNRLEYYLGPERGLGVDSELLYIEFDSSGNFIRCGTRTD